MEPIVFTKDREPDMVGTQGKAWKLDLQTIVRRYPNSAPPELTVAAWVVFAPYAHPVWHSYMIGAISLVAHPNWPPAKINLPGATHEVMVLALNPDHETTVNDRPHHLHPANFVGQFIEPSDEAARERIDKTVADVINGVLNPDTDYMRWWIRRFSASNLRGDPAHAGETRIVTETPDGQVHTTVIPGVPAPEDMH